MKKRYHLKRGRRAACEYDVLIYRDDRLCFSGSFTSPRGGRLKSEDVQVIRAIKAGLQTLEPKS
jgi:hypothetical protein